MGIPARHAPEAGPIRLVLFRDAPLWCWSVVDDYRTLHKGTAPTRAEAAKDGRELLAANLRAAAGKNLRLGACP